MVSQGSVGCLHLHRAGGSTVWDRRGDLGSRHYLKDRRLPVEGHAAGICEVRSLDCDGKPDLAFEGMVVTNGARPMFNSKSVPPL